MTLLTRPFEFDFDPGAIHYGRGCVVDIGAALQRCSLQRALIVCGSNLGANRELMDRVEAGVDDRLVGVFDETTPEKRLETVYDGVETMWRLDAEALVPVGGGSTLDIATAICLLDADFRPFEETVQEVEETGQIARSEDVESVVPMLSVPTTLAGADLSIGGGVIVTDDGNHLEAALMDPTLMPSALFYDPTLFATTPIDALAGSAMNGFNKGLEAVYSQFANPITDATAVRGLQYLRSSLPRLRQSDDPAVLDRAVAGIILTQYGVSVPEAYKLSLVHAFGHALRKQFGIQQGIGHAIIVPHALRLLFDQVDGRRDALATGLEVDGDDTAGGIIDAVTAVRDGLGLPSRLRNVEGTSEAGIPAATDLVAEDFLLELGPPAFDPSLEEIEGVFREAW